MSHSSAKAPNEEPEWRIVIFVLEKSCNSQLRLAYSRQHLLIHLFRRFEGWEKIPFEISHAFPYAKEADCHNDGLVCALGHHAVNDVCVQRNICKRFTERFKKYYDNYDEDRSFVYMTPEEYRAMEIDLWRIVRFLVVHFALVYCVSILFAVAFFIDCERGHEWLAHGTVFGLTLISSLLEQWYLVDGLVL